MGMEISVSLSTVCGGTLEEAFQRLYPAIVSQLKQGDKGSISITIDLKKVPDTETMVTTSYKIAPKFPPTGKASICQIGENFRLKTEPPAEKPKVVNLFTGTSNEGGNE